MRIETIGECTVSFLDDAPVVVIYSVSLRNELPVYVGSTTQLLRHRIRAHVLDAKKSSSLPVHQWMRTNTSFGVTVLERTTVDLRHERERFWVSQFADLLNVTDGGPGLSGHKFAGSDHALRIAAKIKTGVTRECQTCGTSFYRKLSQSVKGNDLFCSRICSNRRVKT